MKASLWTLAAALGLAESMPVGDPVSTRGAGGALETYEAETVKVDALGQVIDRRKLNFRRQVEDLGNGVTLEMTEIPGGTFQMGSAGSEAERFDDEDPAHTVRVPAFLLGTYEVTQAQWRAVALMPKANRDLPANPSFVKGNDLPVTMVTWEEAMEFAERLSRKTGRRYRLPSEAEWEYACRGGTTTRFHFGETITPTLVNYDGNYPFGSAPKGMVRQRPTPVGAMGVANAFGLYDMHGNVWEFCLDPWHGTYSGAPSNGSAWEQGGDLTYRVIRGGGWHNRARFCRSAYRFRSGPEVRGNGLGLRLLRASP